MSQTDDAKTTPTSQQKFAPMVSEITDQQWSEIKRTINADPNFVEKNSVTGK